MATGAPEDLRVIVTTRETQPQGTRSPVFHCPQELLMRLVLVALALDVKGHT